MKKIILIFYFLASIYFAQNITTLNQLVGSSTLIDRPELFREMQAQISDKLEHVEPGIQVDYITNKIVDLRTKILSYIKTPSLKLYSSGDSCLIKYGTQDLVKFKVIEINRNDLLNKMKQEIKTNLLTAIKKDTLKFNQLIDEPFFQKLLEIYRSTFIPTNFNLPVKVNNTGDLLDVLLNLLINYAEHSLNKFLTKNQINLDVNITQQIVDELNDILKNATANLRSNLISTMNGAEDYLRDLVDNYSEDLIASNTGFSITEGNGLISSGISLAFVSDSTLRIGAYINGEYSSTENSDSSTTNQVESLAGFQIQMAGDRYQFDILASGIFLNKFFTSPYALEVGVSYSNSSSSSFIFGGAIFAMSSDKIIPKWAFGITLRGKSSGSPVAFIGLEKQGKDTTPIFKLSQPIGLL